MMQRLFGSVVGVAALLGVAGGAGAADLGVPRAPVAVVSAFSFAGGYVGVYVGGHSRQIRHTLDTAFQVNGAAVTAGQFATVWGAPAPLGLGGNVATVPVATAAASRSATGVALGALAGWNWAIAPQVILGVEGEFGYTPSRAVFALPAAGDTAAFRADWTGRARFRAGYTFDRVMLFAAAGVAITNSRATVSDIGTRSQTLAGLSLGAGVDVAVAPNVILRAEYLFDWYGRSSYSGTATLARAAAPALTATWTANGRVDNSSHTGRIALIVKY